MDRLGSGTGLAGVEPRRAHLAGPDGGSMAGLAQMLEQRGCEVTGPMAIGVGLRAHLAHRPAQRLPRSARLLFHGPGVGRTHPDRLRASRFGVEQATCRDLVARLLGRGLGIAVVGPGRGARVAAAMIGWTLTHAGLDPTVLLGTNSPQIGGRGRSGLGPHVVVETAGLLAEDDAPGAPIALVLGDAPGSVRRWSEASPPGGCVLGEVDGIATGPDDGAMVERFSLEPGHAWWGADVRLDRERSRFRVFHRGRFAVEVGLRVPGRAYVLGALAAVAACVRAGVEPRSIREALGEFSGFSRGFESRGSFRGVTLVDDEASGPGDVGEALEIARRLFGRRRLCATYRPDPININPQAAEFAAADRVLIVDEEGGRGGPRAIALAGALESAGSRVARVSGIEAAIGELDRHLEPGDVLVTLGAGDVGTIADAFLRRLPGHRHA